MNSKTGDDENYYFGEVIGSARGYHRPDCHIVERIYKRNKKLLRSWEEAVLLGLEPCPHCRPPYVASMVETKEPVSPKNEDVTPEESEVDSTSTLNISELSDKRRELLRILDKIDDPNSRPVNEGVGARITRLRNANVISRKIAAFMKTVTETRNAAEYESDEPTESESEAVRQAMIVIKEWLSRRVI